MQLHWYDFWKHSALFSYKKDLDILLLILVKRLGQDLILMKKNDFLDFFHDQLRSLLQPLTKTTLKSKESQVVDHLHQSTEIRHFVKTGIFQLVQRV